MQGLALCREYAESIGIPEIQKHFPDEMPKIAAGLVGDGSECYGFDDAVSRDHDWGPGFCIWLADEDYPRLAGKLKFLYESLPKVFHGVGPRNTSAFGEDRVGVFSVSQFYSGFIGTGEIPNTPDDWLMIPENALCAATNGEVFMDGPGEFTRIRKGLLDFYPEDVRRKKIASRLMTLGQSGQYNFPRSVTRKEWVAAGYAETKFISDAISLVFLINRKYTPFYKWMHRALKELPTEGPRMYEMVEALVLEKNFSRKQEQIQRISEKLIRMLADEGLTDTDSPYLLDHGPEVQKTISDPSLRARNIWVG